MTERPGGKNPSGGAGRSERSTAATPTRGEQSIPLPVVEWILQRQREDPQFLEKLREETGREERSAPTAGDTLDAVLSRLTGLLEGRPGSQPAEQPSQPSVGQPAAGQPSVMTGMNLDLCRFRELLATELYYMQVIPPITPRTLVDLHNAIRNFLGMLKAMKKNPYLRKLMQKALLQAGSSRGDDGRSTADDPELAALAERMARDVVASGDERLLPVAVLLLGAAVAAAVGGVTVGRAVHEATH